MGFNFLYYCICLNLVLNCLHLSAFDLASIGHILLGYLAVRNDFNSVFSY